jgi:hypothetical protein
VHPSEKRPKFKFLDVMKSGQNLVQKSIALMEVFVNGKLEQSPVCAHLAGPVWSVIFLLVIVIAKMMQNAILWMGALFASTDFYPLRLQGEPKNVLLRIFDENFSKIA